jgi:hypothetical protein
MIRWLGLRVMTYCQKRADEAKANFDQAWTGADMDDWEKSYNRWRRRAEWWQDWT